jgi:hypothetical protein
VQGAAELRLGELRGAYVVAVGFVDDDAVGHLHDAAFYALEFVACACELYEQEEVDHGVDGGLALSDAYGLDEDVVVACGFAQHYCLACLSGDASEAACRGAGADEGSGMLGEFFHSGLVAED